MINYSLYEKYRVFLKDKLNNNKINKGTYMLLLISKSYLDNFTIRYNKSEYFNLKIDLLYQEELRDEKLDLILNE